MAEVPGKELTSERKEEIQKESHRRKIKRSKRKYDIKDHEAKQWLSENGKGEMAIWTLDKVMDYIEYATWKELVTHVLNMRHKNTSKGTGDEFDDPSADRAIMQASSDDFKDKVTVTEPSTSLSRASQPTNKQLSRQPYKSGESEGA